MLVDLLLVAITDYFELDFVLLFEVGNLLVKVIYHFFRKVLVQAIFVHYYFLEETWLLKVEIIPDILRIV